MASSIASEVTVPSRAGTHYFLEYLWDVSLDNLPSGTLRLESLYPGVAVLFSICFSDGDLRSWVVRRSFFSEALSIKQLHPSHGDANSSFPLDSSLPFSFQSDERVCFRVCGRELISFESEHFTFIVHLVKRTASEFPLQDAMTVMLVPPMTVRDGTEYLSEEAYCVSTPSTVLGGERHSLLDLRERNDVFARKCIFASKLLLSLLLTLTLLSAILFFVLTI
uniref:p25 n=1 Tax=Fig mild mottle-associated virus TaxID=666641 RepID=D3GBB0_9CLOS|nr:p25 [Fig mild mottle-associated virus]